MQSLLERLRGASADSADQTAKRLLIEAASEIERLQRAAYQGSATRPFGFKVVQEIRHHHVDDILAKDVDARQAHDDRAQLLSILAFVSRDVHRAPQASPEWQECLTEEIPLSSSRDQQCDRNARPKTHETSSHLRSVDLSSGARVHAEGYR